MNLNPVATNEGYVWVRQGVWLFKQNPLGFLMLVFMYVFLAQLAILIPLAGVFAVLILTPALSVGFMTACRQTIQKERILLTVYLAAFRTNNPEVKKRILQLGLVYALMIFTMSLIASMVIDFQALLPFITNDKPITSEVMQQLYYSLMIGGILYIPVAMLMWFAPVLVAWADMPPTKALFASWMACWTNKGAFFYYITIWSVVLIVIPLTLGMFMDIIATDTNYVKGTTSTIDGSRRCRAFATYATWQKCIDHLVAVMDSRKQGRLSSREMVPLNPADANFMEKDMQKIG